MLLVDRRHEMVITMGVLVRCLTVIGVRRRQPSALANDVTRSEPLRRLHLVARAVDVGEVTVLEVEDGRIARHSGGQRPQLVRLPDRRGGAARHRRHHVGKPHAEPHSAADEQIPGGCHRASSVSPQSP